MPRINFVPRPGLLTARFFSAGEINSGPGLYFTIEVPIEPFQFEDKPLETRLRLDFIRLPLVERRQLGGLEVAFPVNPAEDAVDGSIYLGHAHNPVDLTRVAFGPLGAGRISATLELGFIFSFESTTGLDDYEMALRVDLVFDPLNIDTALAAARSHKG